MASLISNEVEWWADDAEKVLGLVLLDIEDNEWVSMVLGRDLDGLFKCIEVQPCIQNQIHAREHLLSAMMRLSSKGDEVYPQNGSVRHELADLICLNQ